MWTIEYRGFYINGYCNKSECTITHYPGTTFKSLLAAKQRCGLMANELEFIERGKS